MIKGIGPDAAVVTTVSRAAVCAHAPDAFALACGRKIGAIGHGPDADRLCERLIEVIDIWSNARDKRPTVMAYPAGTLDDNLQHVPTIEKLHSRLAFTYDR